MFDVTSRESFENTGRWIEEVRQERGEDVILALVGNKTDLAEKRRVSHQVARTPTPPHPVPPGPRPAALFPARWSPTLPTYQQTLRPPSLQRRFPSSRAPYRVRVRALAAARSMQRVESRRGRRRRANTTSSSWRPAQRFFRLPSISFSSIPPPGCSTVSSPLNVKF